MSSNNRGWIRSSTEPSHRVSWEERFEELRQYKAQHGNANVPQKCKPLGTWVETQRREHRKLRRGKHSQLTPERIAALEEIGLTWQMRRDKSNWDDKLAELLQYKEQHGDMNVPVHYEPNRELGGWVAVQRDHYKRLLQNRPDRPSSMTAERMALLNHHGFEWEFKRKTRRRKENNDQQDAGDETTPSKKPPAVKIDCTMNKDEARIWRWIADAVPPLCDSVGRSYARKMVELGFDSVEMIEQEMRKEDLSFMKVIHRRALVEARFPWWES